MKLKNGDKIRVLYGKDKGREGVISRIYSNQEKILIDGINIYKKHIKKTETTPQGGVVELPRPLAVSKVAIICGKCKKLTRIGYKSENGRKFRICKKCGNKL